MTTIDERLNELKKLGKTIHDAGEAVYKLAEDIERLLGVRAPAKDSAGVEPGDAGRAYTDDGFSEPDEYGCRGHRLVDDTIAVLRAQGKHSVAERIATGFVFYGGPDEPHPLLNGVTGKARDRALTALMETWDQLVIGGGYSNDPIFTRYYLVSNVAPPQNRRITPVDNRLVCYPDFGSRYPGGRMPARDCIVWYLNGIRKREGLPLIEQ